MASKKSKGSMHYKNVSYSSTALKPIEETIGGTSKTLTILKANHTRAQSVVHLEGIHTLQKSSTLGSTQGQTSITNTLPRKHTTQFTGSNANSNHSPDRALDQL